MKTKQLLIVLLAAGLVLSASGCGEQGPAQTDAAGARMAESSVETTENTPLPAKEQTPMLCIEPTQPGADGLTRYAFCPFSFEGAEWELQTCVSEEMLLDGELVLDDSGRFRVQAVCGENTYVLLDEEVQLGVPEADVWVDQQERLHLVLRDVRTARYRVTDFVYDAETGAFAGQDVVDGEGINYIGTTGR